MKNLTKPQWQERIIDIAKTLPKDIQPDDHTIMHILIDIVVAEQSRINAKNLARLVGVTASLLQRTVSSTPKPTHATDSGEAVYTEAEIAKHLGVSLEEVQRVTAQLAKEGRDGFGNIDASSIHRVN